jgi:FtsZ-binding cell division protein ZapB
MANNKNNINELVSNEDPTAKLEAITFRQDHLSSVEEPLESDEHTSDLERKVGDDAQTISKLQYDIEQLRARWLGLEAEIQAREEVNDTLTTELNELRESLGLKNELLDSREAEIESLKFELQEQEARYLAAAARQEEKIGSMRKAARSIPKPPPSSSTQDDEPFSQNRLLRTEAYADSLRRKLQDLLASHDKLERENAHLEASVQRSLRNWLLRKRTRMRSTESLPASRTSMPKRYGCCDSNLEKRRIRLCKARNSTASSPPTWSTPADSRKNWNGCCAITTRSRESVSMNWRKNSSERGELQRTLKKGSKLEAMR